MGRTLGVEAYTERLACQCVLLRCRFRCLNPVFVRSNGHATTAAGNHVSQVAGACNKSIKLASNKGEKWSTPFTRCVSGSLSSSSLCDLTSMDRSRCSEGTMQLIEGYCPAASAVCDASQETGVEDSDRLLFAHFGPSTCLPVACLCAGGGRGRARRVNYCVSCRKLINVAGVSPGSDWTPYPVFRLVTNLHSGHRVAASASLGVSVGSLSDSVDVSWEGGRAFGVLPPQRLFPVYVPRGQSACASGTPQRLWRCS
eukprot:4452110-Amphidinium_carterae.3